MSRRSTPPATIPPGTSRTTTRAIWATSAALTFYAFDGIDKLKRYKDGYRNALDGLPIDDDAHQRLVDEAIRAFEYNEALFAELAA